MCTCSYPDCRRATSPPAWRFFVCLRAWTFWWSSFPQTFASKVSKFSKIYFQNQLGIGKFSQECWPSFFLASRFQKYSASWKYFRSVCPALSFTSLQHFQSGNLSFILFATRFQNCWPPDGVRSWECSWVCNIFSKCWFSFLSSACRFRSLLVRSSKCFSKIYQALTFFPLFFLICWFQKWSLVAKIGFSVISKIHISCSPNWLIEVIEEAGAI